MNASCRITLFLSFVFICCNPTENINKEQTKVRFEDEPVTKNKLRQEILNYDSLFINGKIPLRTTKNDLFTLLGQPSVIENMKSPSWLTKFNLENSSNPKRFYFGKTIFEGVGDTLFLRQLDLESTELSLVHSKITISKKTTLDSIFKVFPESYRIGQIECGNECYGIIQIQARKYSSDITWHLVFRGGRLRKVVFFDSYH
jgi:hypothetical protein